MHKSGVDVPVIYTISVIVPPSHKATAVVVVAGGVLYKYVTDNAYTSGVAAPVMMIVLYQ